LTKSGITWESESIIKSRNYKIKKVTSKKFKEEFASLPEMLKNSILSFYKTAIFQSDSLNSLPRREYSRYKRLVNEYDFARSSLNRLTEKHKRNLKFSEFNFILSLNGRYPFQTGVRTFCEEQDIKYFSLEHGQKHGINFHLADFQPQEIRKLDRWINEQIKKLGPLEIKRLRQFGVDWLQKQEANSEQNIFLRFGKATRKNSQTSPRSSSTVLICSSSLDERFSNMGVDLNGWITPYEAYLEVIEKCQKENRYTTFKIHPNILNKSWTDLWRIYLQLNKVSKGRVVGPWSKLSVMDLIDSNEYFVSWGSSLILSAAMREKRSFLLGPTIFSSVIGVPEIGPYELRNLNFEELPILDRDQVELACGVIRNWGYKIELAREIVSNNLNFYTEYLEETKNILIKYKSDNKWKERILRRIKILRNVSKAKYLTPNETVEILNKNLLIPKVFSEFIVKILFYAVLQIFIFCKLISRRKSI
jgi:hypothetical protein